MNYSPLKYKFIAAEKIAARPTIVMLHGNNGSENDLLPLATWFGSDINILSLRGNTKESGPSNFVENFSDEKELNFRTNELIYFLKEFIELNKINQKKLIAIGFSNGADIVNYSLTLFPDFFSCLILMRTHSFINLSKDFYSQNKTFVLITTGKNDESVKEQDLTEWVELLTKNNFNAEHVVLDEGHNLSQEDIELAIKWIAKKH